MQIQAYRVIWNSHVNKTLNLVPQHIQEKFMAWVSVVERVGLPEARRLPGYHDEPLLGRRQGQRSIRLNRAYRAIYIERPEAECQLVKILKVSKHEY